MNNNINISGRAALPLLIASSAQGADRNNMVYIMTDQQSYYMISAVTAALNPSDPYANNNYFKTPNLDRLVKSGYTFSNCYAAHPVSGPSRFALLTGETPNGHGMTGNFSPGGENGERIKSLITTRAMGTLFKNAGYQTYYGGKVHLPWADGRGGKGSIDEKPSMYGFDNYITDDDREELADKGAEFFSTYKGKEPFLLFLSFMNPHDICDANFFFSDRTPGDDITKIKRRELINMMKHREAYRSIDPSLFEGDQLAKLPANTAHTDRFPITVNRPFQDDFKHLKALIWFYYRLVEQVDREIGQILDALEASPYRDNTNIVFTSDHGEMSASHGMRGKNIPYQECQKVPLIFVGKGVKKGVIDNNTPVCNGWDLLPTMLEMSGLAVPKELLGISLYGNMSAGAPINRKYIYMETVNSHGVLEDGRYKYTRFVPRENENFELVDGNEILFDLEKDPGELHNLVYDPSYADKLTQLRAALATEMSLRGIVIARNEAIQKHNVLDCFTAFAMTPLLIPNS
jgi:choline-sulfatase